MVNQLPLYMVNQHQLRDAALEYMVNPDQFSATAARGQ